MTQIVEIFPCGRQGPVHLVFSIPRWLLSRRCKEPGHQLPLCRSDLLIQEYYGFSTKCQALTRTFERCACIVILCGGSVLPKVFWAPVLRTSGSWNLPVRMEGSLVRNFNNYYVLLIHVFDGCSNRFDLCDHFNLVCCCLSPVLISDKRSCWKISQSLKPIWLDVEMLVPLF